MGRYSNISKIIDTKQMDEKNNDFAVNQLQEQNPEKQKLRRLLDPREDLRRDSKLWVRVLYNAYHFNREVYGVLHGLRCGGAQLVLTPESFKLLPGEWTVQEWEENKRIYLDPIKEELVKIFRISRMGKVVSEELPENVFTKQILKEEKQSKDRLVFGLNRGE